ncbi:uncharacterized protein LOC123672160 [Harmonia axyridis]|uniref:uncharacterized protein LOC123672160 n=1 Tax=Harmonia axyridis TaxID=115357 RepID=UPI001E277E98|nr:uncharacterized protein LOC123672160 [Harmonia axyridis]
MACNITKVPLLRTITNRSFASAANVKPIGGVCDYEVNNSTVNGVLVTSAENNSPITRVSIIYRAGSRQECNDNQGVAHVLRICAGMTTKSASQFAITANIKNTITYITAPTLFYYHPEQSLKDKNNIPLLSPHGIM